jgi:hypothetical protein
VYIIKKDSKGFICKITNEKFMSSIIPGIRLALGNLQDRFRLMFATIFNSITVLLVLHQNLVVFISSIPAIISVPVVTGVYAIPGIPANSDYLLSLMTKEICLLTKKLENEAFDFYGKNLQS